MGREIRRVPLDFDWPIGKTWWGYLSPSRYREVDCPDCERGYSPEAEVAINRLWGYAPFDPAETGSTPLTPDTPEVWEFAARNVAARSHGDDAIRREAQRLADMWNRMWMHHLGQDDVDALVADGSLRDLTHTWSREDGWRKIDPPPTITAAEVNRLLLGGYPTFELEPSVIRAWCKRNGHPVECATCEGHSTLERYPGQRAAAERHQNTEPPTGDGWQLWETTSEGSPMSPVFSTAEDLCRHLEASGASWFGETTATYDDWMRVAKGDSATVTIAPGVVMM